MDYRFVIVSVVALLALVACEVEPSASEPPALGSIDAIVAYADEHAITDAGALLEALPDELRANAVLLEASHSQHRADPMHPRIVMFAPGARLFVAISSDPRDPRRDVVEMAELADDGSWRFRTLDLGAAFVDDDRACVSCHGDPARPIWGSYPNWPGAFGDEHGGLTDAQREALAAIVADPSHRVAKLDLDLDLDAGTIYLAGRYEASPNGVLTAELGAAAAESLHARLRHSPRYDDLAPALLLADACWPMEGVVDDAFTKLAEEADSDEMGLRDALYEFLGLDLDELHLEAPAGEATEADHGYWNAGHAYLHGLVSFLVLDDLLAGDPALAELFTSIEPHRRRMLRDWWELEGDDRGALFRAGHEVVLAPDEIFEAALGDPHDARRRAFCEHLAHAIVD